MRELAAVERFAAVEREGGKTALNKLIARKRKKILGKDKKAFRPRIAPARGGGGGGESGGGGNGGEAAGH